MMGGIKERLGRWREWELNPVVVKELRQAVRSWAVTGMLLLFLVVMFCTALGFLVSRSFDSGVDERMGAAVFQSFLVVLTGASLLFIPLYVGVRLALERQESNLDLLYITTLTPHRIIRGKFLCGAYMTVLFFSACMPFMVFTNLLRGVDLPTILFILLCLFLLVCAAVQVAIFLACLPVSRFLKILVALFGTLGMFFIIGSLISLFWQMMRLGVGSMLISAHNFWPGFFTVAGVIFAGVLLLYFLSVALIAPLSANRALSLRVCITVIWALTAALSLAWCRNQHDARLLLPWAIVSFVILIASAVVVVSNHDRLSLRVRRRIPTQPIKRTLAFVFYNGAAGGLVWVALLLTGTFAATSLFLRNAKAWFPGFSTLTPNRLSHFETVSAAVLLYAFAYLLMALLIHRRFFSRRPPKLAGALALLLPAAWSLIPNIVLFFLNQLSWRSLQNMQPGNPFNVFMVRHPGQIKVHVILAGAWVLFMVLLNVNWFRRQIQNFRPLDRRTPPKLQTVPAEVSTAVQ